MVLCVDHANLAWKELQHRLHGTETDGTATTPATNGAGSSADIDAEDFY